MDIKYLTLNWMASNYLVKLCYIQREEWRQSFTTILNSDLIYIMQHVLALTKNYHQALQKYLYEEHLHHPVVCLTTGSKPLTKRSLHILRSTASSFKWDYPLLFLWSSCSFLHLLPCLLFTSISLFIFPSISCFRRQFLCKMWPIQLAFHFLIACRIFLCSLTCIHDKISRLGSQLCEFYYVVWEWYCVSTRCGKTPCPNFLRW